MKGVRMAAPSRGTKSPPKKVRKEATILSMFQKVSPSQKSRSSLSPPIKKPSKDGEVPSQQQKAGTPAIKSVLNSKAGSSQRELNFLSPKTPSPANSAIAKPVLAPVLELSTPKIVEEKSSSSSTIVKEIASSASPCLPATDPVTTENLVSKPDAAPQDTGAKQVEIPTRAGECLSGELDQASSTPATAVVAEKVISPSTASESAAPLQLSTPLPCSSDPRTESTAATTSAENKLATVVTKTVVVEAPTSDDEHAQQQANQINQILEKIDPDPGTAVAETVVLEAQKLNDDKRIEHSTAIQDESESMAVDMMDTVPAATSVSEGIDESGAGRKRKAVSRWHCVWTKHATEDNIPFYYNRTTKKSGWECPAEFLAASMAFGEDVGNEGMAKKKAKISTNGATREEIAALRHQQAIEKEQAKAERERIRLEAAKLKEIQRLESIKRKEEAKAQLEAKRLELQLQREQEKIKRERERKAAQLERERQKEAERLERERQRLIEKQKRDEERRKKDEERRIEREAKEAERLKRKAEEEEARLKKKAEEEEARKRKLGIGKGQAAFFGKFFKKKEKSDEPEENKVIGGDSEKKIFGVFHIQKGMTLAPARRASTGPQKMAAVDEALETQAGSPTVYLTEWKNRKASKGGSDRSPQSVKAEAFAPGDDGSAVVEMDVDEKTGRVKMRLFQFSEDIRPPYYGSMNKRSNLITGRRPFAHEENIDYDYDSGEDWEEEEGDDCASGAEDNESDEEGDAAADAADGFLVAHGYLSDGEGVHDDDDDDDLPREKVVKDVITNSTGNGRNRPAAPLPPACYGCLWGNEASAKPQLSRYSMVPLQQTPIDVLKLESEAATAGDVHNTEDDEVTGDDNIGDSATTSVTVVAEQFVPDFIRIVHGSADGTKKLVNDFIESHETDFKEKKVSKAALERMLKDTAFCKRETRDGYKHPRRFISQDVLAKYDLDTLPLPMPDAAAGDAKKVENPKGKRMSRKSILTQLKEAQEAQKARPKWSAHIDEGTGVTYYYNELTQESVWEKPADYVQPTMPGAPPK